VSQLGLEELVTAEERWASSPLGSHEGLSERERIEDPRRGCPRWPAGLLLRWKAGEMTGYVEGRCKGVNVCSYCAVQAAHENAKMLSIEAEEGQAPKLLLILTTREPTDDPRPFYYGRQEVIRCLRARFGRQVEYASLCEFTTGQGRRSQGLRRPHWNVFVKGVPVDGVDEARELVREVWCRHVDAEPEAQYVEEIRDAAAAAKYVAMHFQKESQAPPHGWRGQRFNCSRGFFYGRTRAEMRQLARAELQRDRERWKVAQAAPELDDETVNDIAEELLWRRQERVWQIVAVNPIKAEELLAGCQPAQRASATERWRVLSPSEALRGAP
jgi:hypothetical protein